MMSGRGLGFWLATALARHQSLPWSELKESISVRSLLTYLWYPTYHAKPCTLWGAEVNMGFPVID